MKHVKRIAKSLVAGLFMGLLIGLVNKFMGTHNWGEIAWYTGSFYGLGCWLGIGMDFDSENTHSMF